MFIVRIGYRPRRMMRNFYILTFLFFGLFTSSCEETDITHDSDFEKSFSMWLTFKKNSGNSYRYTVNGASLSGDVTETEITVEQGKVVERAFKYLMLNNPDGVSASDKEWRETAAEVGSHHPSQAAEPLTLDQIYERARTKWLFKRENVNTYFEAKNSGLISACGYIDKACVTNCADGIVIRSIEKL